MKNLILVTLLLLSSSVFAKEFRDRNEIRKFADTFMEQIIQENFQKAFDIAKPSWPIPTVEIDNLVNTIKTQWPIVSSRFGKPIEMEFIRNERIGKSFLRYYYLHKFNKHAIYWQIDFYRPNKSWVINSISFQDKLNVLYK